ncbi:hypothetical protein NQ317_016245 [Molorchus minor]|uniref:Uncharacterized protein n=1 Tax=Molorchus minor TaxID=1323400 RepID=A0ABQ9JXR5_9CUCU|nr:hypothetical protein NQ317_016245 [Molorchus minor]
MKLPRNFYACVVKLSAVNATFVKYLKRKTSNFTIPPTFYKFYTSSKWLEAATFEKIMEKPCIHVLTFLIFVVNMHYKFFYSFKPQPTKKCKCFNYFTVLNKNDTFILLYQFNQKQMFSLSLIFFNYYRFFMINLKKI